MKNLKKYKDSNEENLQMNEKVKDESQEVEIEKANTEAQEQAEASTNVGANAEEQTSEETTATESAGAQPNASSVNNDLGTSNDMEANSPSYDSYSNVGNSPMDPNATVDIEEDKEVDKNAKFNLGRLAHGAGSLAELLLLSILLGSPVLAIAGFVCIKYNKQVMTACNMVNYKPMLIPKM